MRHSLHIVATLSALLCAMASPAATFTVDGITYTTTTPEGISGVEVTTLYNLGGYSGAVNVPEDVSYDGHTHTVVGIAARAFYKCYELTSISLPKTIRHIGTEAFYQCASLCRIDLWAAAPPSVDGGFVGYSPVPQAFFNVWQAELHVPVYSLAAYANDKAWNWNRYRTWADLGPRTTLELYHIGAGTLLDNINLDHVPLVTDLTLGGQLNGTDFLVLNKFTNLLTLDISSAEVVAGGKSYYNGKVTENGKLPPYAFYGMPTLQSVNLPRTIYRIGDNAFDSQHSLLSVTIPDNVEEIGREAFSNCYNLAAIDLPTSVNQIASAAFSHCEKLTDVILPEGLGEIKSDVFRACSGLRQILIPQSVTIIGSDAFSFCSNLTAVKLPDNIKTLDQGVFYQCNLKGIVLPASLGRLWNRTLNCDSLTLVRTYSAEPQSISGNTFSDFTFNNATLYVPAGSKTDYWLDQYWGKFKHIEEFDASAIDTPEADNAPAEIFDLGGRRTASTAHGKGIYIIRKGKQTKKIAK